MAAVKAVKAVKYVTRATVQGNAQMAFDARSAMAEDGLLRMNLVEYAEGQVD